jgi:poly(glycerol-phosphate) alpha-glucosyltransferase
MVVLEAWAYHKPVIMTPGCNLPEGFIRGAALKIQPDVENIRKGLGEFLELSEAERTRMAQRGHALIQEKFVWSKIAGDTARLYEWILGAGPKPGFMADF